MGRAFALLAACGAEANLLAVTKRGRGRPSKEQPGADRRAAEVDRERLVRELEIHQVELEMQNEELRQAQESLAASLRHVSDLYDHAPVGYATLDQETSILEINLTGAAMLGRPSTAGSQPPVSSKVKARPRQVAS